MDERPLGETGLRVPVVGMGTWRTFDVDEAAEEGIRSVVDVGLDRGMRLFDSSPMYGRAERVLGRALSGRRDQAIIATKLWTAADADAERQADFAFHAFGGRIDLYQVHNLVRWERRLDLLERRRDAGQVTAIGATHYLPSAFSELARAMRSGRLDAIQVPYNPWSREVEREILPLAAELGLGVLVMRPFADAALLRDLPPAAELDALAPTGIRTWAQALLAWGLGHPAITTSIPATSKPDRAAENAAGGDLAPLDPDTRERIATLFTR